MGVEPVAVEEVAEELYGLRPDEFVAARADHARRARAAGHRELAAAIGALRKPSTAAWVVNLLVRRAGDQVDRLLDLGGSLRAAQASLAGDALKELGRQRGQVVAAMGREGRRLAREAGHPVSAGIEEEVVGTLRAALADPRAAQAIRTGRLTSALTYAGLGEVGPAVTVPGPGPAAGAGDDGSADGARRAAERRREAERLARERREARAALAEAERAYDEAAAAQSAATVALQDARADQDRAQARVAELADALRRAQEDAAGATAAVRPRRREHDAARHALDVARRAVDRARARVDRLDA